MEDLGCMFFFTWLNKVIAFPNIPCLAYILTAEGKKGICLAMQMKTHLGHIFVFPIHVFQRLSLPFLVLSWSTAFLKIWRGMHFEPFLFVICTERKFERAGIIETQVSLKNLQSFKILCRLVCNPPRGPLWVGKHNLSHFIDCKHRSGKATQL